jgi:uncharacterized protein YecA (UPF0149 family)
MQYVIGPDGSLVPAGGARGPQASQQQGPSGEAQQQRPAQAPAPQLQRQAADFSNLMRGPSRMTMGRGPVGGGSPSQATPSGGGAGLPGGIDPSKIGRNDLCPCGSGKKYKKCHGT